MQSTYSELLASAKQSIIKQCNVYQDYPVKGVGFLDISPIFMSTVDFDNVLTYWQHRFTNVDLVVGLEARGFVIGAAFAQKIGAPFMMIRKKGKLPGQCISEAYVKEYGADEFEAQVNALSKTSFPSDRKVNVLIMDDILATGGTLCASIELVRKLLSHNNVKEYKISTSLISSIKVLRGKEKIYEKYNDVSIDVIHEI
ncbi:hypothetical protein CYY_007308 [Polysphondylium violaceum]|uniref:adenine phosphoribosyltransferase n=1 Tax=Polysphondylium violaceum TaxID=133409 RepID=A0A8J4UY35_9MYCE|nr:hypothetical protein CYY_007308 [Polysphondylium violaceum]